MAAADNSDDNTSEIRDGAVDAEKTMGNAPIAILEVSPVHLRRGLT